MSEPEWIIPQGVSLPQAALVQSIETAIWIINNHTCENLRQQARTWLGENPQKPLTHIDWAEMDGYSYDVQEGRKHKAEWDGEHETMPLCVCFPEGVEDGNFDGYEIGLINKEKTYCTVVHREKEFYMVFKTQKSYRHWKKFVQNG